jgi:hypothetical protein
MNTAGLWPFGNPVTGALNKMMSWITGLIVDAFDSMFNTVKTILVSTPDVTTLPQVQTVTARAVTVVDIIFVLAFLTAGILTVFAGGNEKARYTAKALLPRLVFAFVIAHFSPEFCSKIITLANGVSAAMSSDGPGRRGAFTAVSAQLHDQVGGNTPALLFAVLATLITVLFAGVAFSFTTRIGVLMILAITGPLALACFALPQLEATGKLWWRALIGCLITPLLQMLALQSGQTVMLDPNSMGILFGVPGGGVMNLVIVVALLRIAVKIPGLVRTNVMHTNGHSFASQVLRVVVIQRGLRALSSVGRR